MTGLFLDPSSTVIGFAVMDDSQRLLEAGLVTPDVPRQAHWLNRSWSLLGQVLRLNNEVEHDVTVIEVPSGKTHGRKRDAQNLIVYGFAVGMYVAHLKLDTRRPTRLVPDNVWTRRVPKPDRAAAVARTFASYDPELDPGLDMADAIALGQWFFTELRTRA